MEVLHCKPVQSLGRAKLSMETHRYIKGPDSHQQIEDLHALFFFSFFFKKSKLIRNIFFLRKPFQPSCRIRVVLK